MTLPAKYKLSEIASVLGATRSREAVCASTTINMYGLDPSYNSGAKFSDMLSNVRTAKKLSCFKNYDHSAVPSWITLQTSLTGPSIAVVSNSGKYQDMTGYSLYGGPVFDYFKCIDFDPTYRLLWVAGGLDQFFIYDPLYQLSSSISAGSSSFYFSLCKVVGNYVFIAFENKYGGHNFKVYQRGNYNTIKYSPSYQLKSGGTGATIYDVIEDPNNSGSFLIVDSSADIYRYTYSSNTLTKLDGWTDRTFMACVANSSYFAAMTTESHDYSKITALPVTSGDSYNNLAYYSSGNNPTYLRAWGDGSYFYFLARLSGIYKFIRASSSTAYQTASGITPMILSDGNAYYKSGYYIYQLNKYDFSQSTLIVQTPVNGGLVFKI